MVNTNFDLWENEVECPVDKEIASPLASLRQLQISMGEEFGRRRTLLPSVLRPLGGVFKGEL